MDPKIKDLYFVAVKVFLEDDAGNFLITKDVFGEWDIPGGRLREVDFEIPLEDIVKRKMTEELGNTVQYTLHEPVAYMRHERNELLPNGEREIRRIFAIGYRATYLGGEITLGKNHEEMKWASRTNFVPEDYFTGGWLKGVKEYVEKVRI